MKTADELRQENRELRKRLLDLEAHLARLEQMDDNDYISRIKQDYLQRMEKRRQAAAKKEKC